MGRLLETGVYANSHFKGAFIRYKVFESFTVNMISFDELKENLRGECKFYLHLTQSHKQFSHGLCFLFRTPLRRCHKAVDVASKFVGSQGIHA